MAESFGVDAERYDRTRPRYPEALVRRIVDASPGTAVLDAGCGTGIASRQFQAAGCTVLGVDVDERMAAYAQRRGLEVEVAAFESWDPAGRTFDAVVSGQTWHWIDPVAGPAKAAEALRPGGRLAVFWNAGVVPPEVAGAFAEVYERLMPGSLAARAWSSALAGMSAMAEKTIGGIRDAGGFAEPEQWSFRWERTYTRDEWLDQLPTTGTHTSLPRAQLDEVLANIGEAVDAFGGSFTMDYTAQVVTAVRTVTAA